MTENKKESFHYRVSVGHVSSNPFTVALEADERERAALAAKWGVLKVNSVAAELELTRWKRDGARIKGRVQANIEQSCVVTLEPVASSIDERINALLVPEGSKLARIKTDDSGEMVIDAEGPDMPETFVGDSIDLGTVCEEFAVLAIDPYPRKEGAVLESPEQATDEDANAPSPFAGLESWNKGKRGA
ncbi:MAG: DUF177 domain-containing protein [Hyphomicrobiales bacterium]|nr:DUF177 domain-containing protein [Hyphomicrobiales bacterium]MCP5000136.1 DUF177 domain-containing protein [Hyphomicrobiales bacterium]